MRLFLLIIISLLISINTVAQTDIFEKDPLAGDYFFAKKSDAVILQNSTVNNGYFYMGIYTFNKELQVLKTNKNLRTEGINYATNWSVYDGVTADFNNDGMEDLITSEYIVSGIPCVRFCAYSMDNTNITRTSQTSHYSVTTNTQIRRSVLSKGDLDGDGIPEVVAAFITKDNKIRIYVFKLNEENKLILIDGLGAENAIDLFDISIDTHYNNYYEYAELGDNFDIACGNFQTESSKDEIVVVHGLDFECDPGNSSDRYKDNTKQRMQFKYCALELNDNKLDFIRTDKNAFANPINIVYNVDDGNKITNQYDGYPYRIGRPVLRTINNKGTDQLIMGFVLSRIFSYYPYYYRRSMFTLWPMMFDNALRVSEPNENNPLYLLDNWSQNYGNDTWLSPNTRDHFTFNMEAVDINRDNTSELICSGIDSIFILSFASINSPKFRKITGIPFNNNQLYNLPQKQFAISDVNADTATNNWQKELIYLNYSNITTKYNPVQWQTITDVGDITLNTATITIDSTYSPPTTSLKNVCSHLLVHQSNTQSHRYYQSVLAGDFMGKGIRCGKPTITSHKISGQPLLVLNTPPFHYDIIDGTVFDVNKVFSDPTDEAWLTYTNSSSNKKSVTYSTSRSHILSSNLKGALKVCGVGVESELKYNYGKNFSNSRSVEKETSIQSVINVYREDRLEVIDSEYDFIEYPLYYNGALFSHFLIKTPTTEPHKQNIAAHTWDGYAYVADHEIGNMLSYRGSSNFSNPDVMTSIYKYPDSWETSNTSTKEETITLTNAFEHEVSNEKENGIGINVIASAGYEGDGEGWSIEASIEAGLQSDYNFKEANISKTTLSTEESIEIKLFSYDETTIGDARVFITPYVYWSKSNAFVIDYMIDPIGPFWDRYKTHPDLAFILPWKFAKEKGETGIIADDPTIIQRTKDIIIDPQNFKAGDTLTLKARLHNYSLYPDNIPITDIDLQFYIGDPDNGGKLIYDPDNNSYAKSNSGDLGQRSEAFFYLKWKVPSDLENPFKLYAIVDPDNKIAELRTDNNKGWTTINIDQPLGLDDTLHKDKTNTKNKILTCFPNPTSNTTNISFELKSNSKIKIELFNLCGQKLENIVTQFIPPGEHTIPYNTNHLNPGYYIIQLTINNKTHVVKMVKLANP